MTDFYPRLDGSPFAAALGKIVCVGRNYVAHAAELNNPVPGIPLLFIKPASAVADLSQPLALPEGLGPVHHEVEIAVLIGHPLHNADRDQALNAIAGVGVALDLTLRSVQDQLKRDGHPWERAKAFDGAYPMSHFVDAKGLDWGNLSLELWRNGTLQQAGNSAQMLFAIIDLLAQISAVFSLQAGDVVSTGTPAGVGPLESGDKLIATLGAAQAGDLIRVETRVS